MQAGHDSQSQNHSQQQGHHPGLHQNTQSGSGSSSVSNLAGRSPLEALQEQQRLFQEQLTALQDQQRQLQATAAAVAAQAMQQQQQQSMAQQGQGQSPARGGNMGMGSTFASGSQQTSPYIAGTSGASSTSGPSRPATTPGNMGSAEPSPSYFSPLTSPALEASARFQSFGHSGGRTSQYNQTFPLSALSSPALNPVGSSGGANQTLSPALNPVLDSGRDDPEYVRQLLGSMDQMGNNGATGQGMMMQGQNGNSGAPMAGAPSQIFSPVQMPTMASHSHGHSHSSHTSSPLVTGSAGSSAGPGPHRQSLPPKTRPSPLIKPTHHRHRHGGNGSIPSSPLIPIYKNSNAAAMAMMGGGNATNGAVVPGTYLPSAAVEQVAQTASTSSTPSPVDLRDLRDIMPPPPVPSKHTQNGDGSMNGMGMSGHGMVQPMTPAAMMNMGSHPVGMSMSMSRGIGSGMGSVTLPSSNAAEEQRLTGKGSGINGAGPARVANGATSGANQGQGNGAKMPIAPGPKGRKTAIAPAAPHAQDGPSPGAAGSAVRKGKGVKKGGRGGGAVGVRAGKFPSLPCTRAGCRLRTCLYQRPHHTRLPARCELRTMGKELIQSHQRRRSRSRHPGTRRREPQILAQSRRAKAARLAESRLRRAPPPLTAHQHRSARPRIRRAHSRIFRTPSTAQIELGPRRQPESRRKQSRFAKVQQRVYRQAA